MGRWKGVIGPELKARNIDNQKTEVRIGVSALNKMTALGIDRYMTYFATRRVKLTQPNIAKLAAKEPR